MLYHLTHRRPQRRLSEAEARWMFQQLAVGLAYCHDRVRLLGGGWVGGDWVAGCRGSCMEDSSRLWSWHTAATIRCGWCGWVVGWGSGLPQSMHRELCLTTLHAAAACRLLRSSACARNHPDLPAPPPLPCRAWQTATLSLRTFCSTGLRQALRATGRCCASATSVRSGQWCFVGAMAQLGAAVRLGPLRWYRWCLLAAAELNSSALSPCLPAVLPVQATPSTN